MKILMQACQFADSCGHGLKSMSQFFDLGCCHSIEHDKRDRCETDWKIMSSCPKCRPVKGKKGGKKK